MNPKKNRLYEGTPLDQRDEVAAFQAQRDKEEATPAAEKFGDELHKRNEKYLEVWRDFIDRLCDAAVENHSSRSVLGFGCLESGDPYIPATGYFDSASFYVGDDAGDDPEVEGVGIYLYHLDNTGDIGVEAGGCDFDEFIARVKREKGLEILLGGFWAIDEDDDDYQRIAHRGYDTDFKQAINAHVKCMINFGFSRKEVAKEVQFLNNVDKKDFPGCSYLNVLPENSGRVMPTILASYKVSPIPTKEEQDNVVKGLKTLLDNMCHIGSITE